MKTNQISRKSSQWPVYWAGLSAVAVGGGLMAFAALRAFAVFANGAGNLRIGPLMLAQVIGGGLLLLVGFAAMAGSAHFAAGATMDFDLQPRSPALESERCDEIGDDGFVSRDDSPISQFGPPKPFIMIRCRRCETLNSEHRTNCTACESLI